MTNAIEAMCQATNKTCASLSLDDFYLTGDEQDTLASQNPTNPLLQFRGNGVHIIVIFL